jgi:hypothetical protein
VNVPAWTLATPRAKDVLHAVRLAPRPRLTRRLSSLPSWSWFGAGLVLGAGLALLLTTTTGVGSYDGDEGSSDRPVGDPSRGAERGATA